MPPEENLDLYMSGLERLRERLLDLTGKNRLINFTHRKSSSLRVIDELPGPLSEILLDDKELVFRPVPEPKLEELVEHNYIEIDSESGQEISLKKYPDAKEWATILGIPTSLEVQKPSQGQQEERHLDTDIQTALYSHELENRLQKLRQTANSAIQEMGVNVLYLAMGFLQWQDTNDGKVRLAPLFLIPIALDSKVLNRKTMIYEYKVRYSGEDIIPNLSLKHKLRIDFGIDLPDIDEHTNPEDYMSVVSERVSEPYPTWKVRRFISVALLNFSKLLMYLDLDDERWPSDSKLSQHKLVERYIRGDIANGLSENSGNDNYHFGDAYSIDTVEEIHEKYPLVEDADSSQHSALIDVLNGQSLVIEGPPGTGKSQTITNIIASLLGQGKSVLFVAEKLAALEVVKGRLDSLGLGTSV